jgi:hypothetical protein
VAKGGVKDDRAVAARNEGGMVTEPDTWEREHAMFEERRFCDRCG